MVYSGCEQPDAGHGGVRPRVPPLRRHGGGPQPAAGGAAARGAGHPAAAAHPDEPDGGAPRLVAEPSNNLYKCDNVV